MIKADIVAEVTKVANLPRLKAQESVDLVFDAIRDALARPDEARARAARMAARIRERHSASAFAEAVGRLITFSGAGA